MSKKVAKRAVRKVAPKVVIRKPMPRIGSIVRYVDDPEGSIMIVLWRDDNDHERKNEPDPKARYTWQGVHLSSPCYDEFMYVSDKMVEDGEAEIIGHFDFFSLVNGNDNR